MQTASESHENKHDDTLMDMLQMFGEANRIQRMLYLKRKEKWMYASVASVENLWTQG